MYYKLPIVLTPQPEGAFTATSPVLLELVTEGETLEEAMANVKDAFAVVAEGDDRLGCRLASEIPVLDVSEPLLLKTVVALP